MSSAPAYVSYLGAATGILSLLWQIVSWRRSGSRVRVASKHALPILPRGPDSWYLTVEARNAGRLAVTVDSWGFSMGRRRGNIVPLRHEPWFDRVPLRLEPGASATFGMPADEVRRLAQEQGVSLAQLKPWVSLGDGSRVVSRRSVPLS